MNLERFGLLMNEKARELNMINSVFNDPAGIENYSTANDILNCLIEAVNTEVIYDIFTQKKDVIKIKGSNEREMAFESKTLLGTRSEDLTGYYKTICGKGGTLSIPKIFNSAVVVETSDNVKLACVVMNAYGSNESNENRFAAIKQAVDAALGNAGERNVCAKSAIVCIMPENKRDELNIIYKKNPCEIIKPASMSKMLTAIVVLEHIKDIRTEICVKQEMIDMIPDIFYHKDFMAGDIVSVRDLLSAMFLPSSNAAAYILGCVVGEMI